MMGLGIGSGNATNENPTVESKIFQIMPSAYAEESTTVADEAPKVEPAPAPAEPIKVEVPKLPGSGDDPASDLTVDVFLKALVESLGSFKGASALMLVALLAQLLMLLLRTPLGKFAGKWKLLIIYLLSMVGGAVALKVSTPEMGWLAIVLHSNTLAMAQVFANQVKKQFWDKKDEAVPNV